MNKKVMSVLFIILVLSMTLTGCGKPSKKECEELLLEGKLNEFHDGECVNHMIDELGL